MSSHPGGLKYLVSSQLFFHQNLCMKVQSSYKKKTQHMDCYMLG